MRSIKDLREEQGWSQFELAVKVGVTPGAVGSWERGDNEPRFSHVRKLAELFGVSMDQIVWEPRKEEEQGKAAA